MSTASKEIRHIFIWTRSFITAFTVALHMSLSWARSIQNTSPHHTPWRSILIIFSHLRLSFPSGLFLCGLPSKILDALCFQVSDAVTLFRCFGCTNGSLQVRNFVKCFVTLWFVTVKICFVSRPTPELEDHPLSPVRYCLFNIFAATLHTGGRSYTRKLRTLHAVASGTHHGYLCHK